MCMLIGCGGVIVLGKAHYLLRERNHLLAGRHPAWYLALQLVSSFLHHTTDLWFVWMWFTSRSSSLRFVRVLFVNSFNHHFGVCIRLGRSTLSLYHTPQPFMLTYSHTHTYSHIHTHIRVHLHTSCPPPIFLSI
jgi:hypothetical protein